MSTAASEAAYDPGTLQPQPQPSLAYQHAPALQLGNAVAPAISANAGPSKCDQNLAMPLAVVPAPHPTVNLPPGFLWGLWRVGLVSPHAAAPSPVPPPPPPSPVAPSANATQQVKRRRWQLAAAGSGVIALNPQVITVQPGEDVAMKVMSYSCDGWAVCILSANGVVSNVALNRAPSPYETVIYEGYFQILSLSGSYMLSETDGLRFRKGGLGISLAGPDGQVSGGGVAGPLTAASLVQVVIGRFPVTNGVLGASSSTQRGAMNGSSGGPGSPANYTAAGSFNSSRHPVFYNFP